MGPTDVKAWSDALGPTLIAVIALVVVILPMLRRDRQESGGDSDIKVRLALMEREIARIVKHLNL
jgi:hypothetical protein